LAQLHEDGDWKTLMEVFALTLFGILLFPKAENFVDETAIRAFIAFKNHSENPITGILGDTYIALDSCHSKYKKRLVCCLPVLFIWLISHFEERVVGIKGPMESVQQQRLEVKKASEWSQCLAGLT